MYQIYNADCFQKLDELIESNFKVDYVFTSPPYGRKRNDKYENFDDNIEDYYKFITDITYKLLKVCNKYVFMNIMTTYYNRIDVYKYIGTFADKIQNTIIWNKTNPIPSTNKDNNDKWSMVNSYEYIFVLGDTSLKSNFCYTKNFIETSVNTNHEYSSIHKAVMNQTVSDWIINTFTSETESVLDPFMGLGTTGISCLKMNRMFYGIEKDKKYFDIADQRLKEYNLNILLT